MEFLFNICYYLVFLFLPIVIYNLFFTINKPKHRNNGKIKGVYYIMRFLNAKPAIRKLQNKCRSSLEQISPETLENVKKIHSENYTDNHFIYGADQKGNNLSIRLTIRAKMVAETFLCLRLSNGAIFTIPDNKTKLDSTPGWNWKTKHLKIEVVEPLKRLRIIYNGLLLDQATNKIKHVNFRFLWNCASAPLFYPQDADTALLADALANEKWRDGNWMSLLGDQEGYEQFGELHGTIMSETNEIILRLPSCRSRFWGTDEKLSLKNSLHLFVAGKEGDVLNVWAKNLKNGCKRLKYGNVITCKGRTFPISDSDLNLELLTHNISSSSLFVVHIKANNEEHKCVFHLNKTQSLETTGLDGYQLSNIPADCDLDMQQGKSLVEFWYNTKNHCLQLPPPLITENQIESIPKCYIANLDSDIAKSVKLTGGKGCSLALLSSLKSDDFSVPEGFVVTVNAFRSQLDKNVKLRTIVSILNDSFCGKINGSLEDPCTEAVQLFKSEKILPEIENEIRETLQNSKSDDVTRWAVRSSAIGEDSEELSTAGQNETFLGCTTADEVINAVAACWGSLFSYQSVQYRYRFGAPIKTEMAVIVQKMVPADCAGVLFTCHPLKENSAQMVITSNHGLGESVVSAKSEPDTVILNRDVTNSLTIESKTLGTKTKIIEMGESGVVERDGLDSFSITDEQALKLGQVGVSLEERFGGSRDIEWAYHDGRLFLLQCRPITTMRSWTNYELLHEFDHATLTDDVIYTIANAAEVFPVATSVLTSSVVVGAIDKAMQKRIWYEINPYIYPCLPTFEHHVFLDVVHSIHKNPMKTIDVTSKIIDLSIFGHPVIDETIHALSVRRHGVSPRQLIGELLNTIKFAWQNEEVVKQMKLAADNIQVGIDEDRDTIKDVYVKIDSYINKMPDILVHHATSSATSVAYQVFAMRVLMGTSTEFSLDHQRDIADMLSSCQDIISADIPTILDKIRTVLIKNDNMTEFSKIDPETGRHWLETNCREASELFEKFLKEHGHRGIAEFELTKSTWAMKPREVIKMIQINTNTGGTKIEKTPKSVDDVIKSLITPKNEATRKILKFFMKRSRRAVAIREQTKSETIKIVNKLRIAYKHLAFMMKRAGQLPSRDLIFHLSHHEIGQIINGPHPVLVFKALWRRRLYHEWNEFKYTELTYGVPRAERKSTIETDNGEVKLEGTPVCFGTVKARACVVTTLNEIDQLRNGDILITYSTDVGWSPYFPLVSGVVTELGGIVSHGAVIAREYGLPCIVGVKGATTLIKNGDVVVLSGKTGTVEVISKQELATGEQ